MAYWADFYGKLFNFQEIRYFDIQGEYTGLTSKAMTAPDGLIRIPLNEEARQGGGQIEEFLMQFNGEGIQHIALLTDNLLDSIDQLQLAGIPLLSSPNALYYDNLERRLPATASRSMHCRHVASCWTALLPAASRVCCCRSSPNRCWGRCSSNSSSAREIIAKASAKAISRPCSNRWSVIRSAWCAGDGEISDQNR
jgi:hypothetical protein